MQQYHIGILLVSSVFAPAILAVETSNQDADYLRHAIPPDAERFGPMQMRHDITHYYYYLSDLPRVNSNIVAREAFHKQSRVERELYKNGKKHGVRLEWFSNGQLRSEAPYRDGLMHGTFKHWDEAGKLIGQYVITNGSGTRRIYYPNGQLESEAGISSNVLNGLCVTMFKNGQVQSVSWCNNGSSTNGFTFYESGNLELIAWHPAGPAVFFRPDGSVREKMWRGKSRDLSEAHYAKAAAEDPSLPPYYKDASKYKDFVDDRIKGIIQKYRKLPRVKIPLEFDEKGEPLLAEQ